MKKLFLLFFLLFLQNNNLYNRISNKTIDSLSDLLSKSNGLEKVKILSNISVQYDFVDIDSSFLYANEAIKLSKSLNNFNNLEEMYLMKLSYYKTKGFYDSCFTVANELKAEAELRKNSNYTIWALYLLAESYSNTRDYLNMIDNFLKAIDLANYHESKHLQIIYFRYGTALASIKKFYEAITNIKKSINLLENEQTNDLLGSTYGFIANYYQQINQNDSSEYYFNKCLNFYKKIKPIKNWNKLHMLRFYSGFLLDVKKDIDSALIVALEILKEAEEFKYRRLLGDIATLISHFYSLKKDFNKELQYNYYALSVRKSINLLEYVASSYINLSTTYYNLKNLDSSLYFLDLAYNLSNKNSFLNYKSIACKKFYMIYLDKKNFEKALSYYTEYTILKDSLDLKSKNNEYIKLLIDHELTLKEKEQRKLDFNRQKSYVVVLLIFIIIIFSFFFVILKYYFKLKDENDLLKKDNSDAKILIEELEKFKKNQAQVLNNMELLINERTSALTNQIEKYDVLQNEIKLSKTLFEYSEFITKSGSLIIFIKENKYHYSEGFYSIWGLFKEDYKNLNQLVDLVIEQDYKRISKIILNITKIKKNFKLQFKIKTNNNQLKNVKMEIEPIFNNFTEIDRIIVVFNEITKTNDYK